METRSFRGLQTTALVPKPSQPAYTLTVNTIQPYRDVIQSSALESTSCEPEFDIIRKLYNAFSHLVQTIDGNMKQDSPQVKTEEHHLQLASR